MSKSGLVCSEEEDLFKCDTFSACVSSRLILADQAWTDVRRYVRHVNSVVLFLDFLAIEFWMLCPGRSGHSIENSRMWANFRSIEIRFTSIFFLLCEYLFSIMCLFFTAYLGFKDTFLLVISELT
jgi:hypothetical protein